MIGIDVDGVCANIHHTWLERYNRDYNDTLTVDGIHQWDMLPAVKPECGKKIYSYLNEPDFYENMPVIEGALEGVNMLREWGHGILFITTCVPKSGDQKIDWLIRNGFTDEHATGVIALYGKYSDKSYVGADMLIDDYDLNFKNWKNHGILFDAPYNRGWIGNWERVNGWAGVPAAVLNALHPVVVG